MRMQGISILETLGIDCFWAVAEMLSVKQSKAIKPG